jgi:hypothetical protein
LKQLPIDNQRKIKKPEEDKNRYLNYRRLKCCLGGVPEL